MFNNARKAKECKAHQHDARDVGDAARQNAGNGAIFYANDLRGFNHAGEQTDDQSGNGCHRDSVECVAHLYRNVDEEHHRDQHQETHRICGGIERGGRF